MGKVEDIKNFISQKMPDAVVQTTDMSGNENHLHLGVLVASDLFKGKMLLEQHKMVMSILKEKFKDEIHAIQLKTMTNQEYQHNKEQR